VAVVAGAAGVVGGLPWFAWRDVAIGARACGPGDGRRCDDRAMHKLMVTTMNELPGHQVQQVFGEVFGLTVRSRNMFSDIGAGLKGLVGGEVKGYTKLLEASREEAVDRLRANAQAMGANAVIAMRFDCNEIASNMTEIAAYGTAVVVAPMAH
jgi:uncharacterized protein YbjQ (UPF0145 family)